MSEEPAQPTPVARQLPVGMHLHLDLKTTQLPQNEMNDLESSPVRSIDHDYGAWVHVPPAEFHWEGDDLNPEVNDNWEQFPNLRNVLLKARELGADWINFDADGDTVLAGLPTFDW